MSPVESPEEQILVWKVEINGETHRFEDVDTAVEFISASIENEKGLTGAVLESERMTRAEYERAVELEDTK